MPRPRKEDPTVAVPFRIKRSAYKWWESKAAKEGLTLAQLLRRVLEERAAR